LESLSLAKKRSSQLEQKRKGKNEMKQDVNFNDFVKAFRMAGREDQFSREGLRLLYDGLAEYENSAGVNLELDVIALCCEFAEYADMEEFLDDYDLPGVLTLEDVAEHTIVFSRNWSDNETFVIQNF